MIVKGKLLFGPILALIGGTSAILASIVAFVSIGQIEAGLVSMGLTWEDVGLPPQLLYVRFIVTLLWGVLGITGVLFALFDWHFGHFISLITGILILAGQVIPIGTITITSSQGISLSGTLGFMDMVFLLFGGFTGLVADKYRIKVKVKEKEDMNWKEKIKK
jgi:hypothetical protein